MKKRVIIAGGSGFIGQALATVLTTSGHDVTILSRKRGDWDPERGYLPKERLEGKDVVVNLAGESLLHGFFTKKQKEKILQSRVESTKLLVRTIEQLKAKPEVFISASAIGYYGNRGDQEVDEEDSVGAGFLASVCKDWEEAALQLKGVRTVTMRIGVVLSPKGGALKMMLPIFRLGLGGRLGSGRQWVSWIGLLDLVRLFQFAIDEPSISGPLIACSPDPMTNAAFTQQLAKAVHRPAFMHVPQFLLQALLGEMADEMLLTSVKAMPSKALRAGFTFTQRDLASTILLDPR